jgi:hypothetical protein
MSRPHRSGTTTSRAESRHVAAAHRPALSATIPTLPNPKGLAPAKPFRSPTKVGHPSIWVLRKVLSPLSTTEAMELLLGRLTKSKSNAEFLNSMSAPA